MAKRKIVEIDEEKCNGCGECIPNCPEGALQIIDNKARLVSDLFCDGLGACIGKCPQGAIEIIERDAEPYSETKVMEKIVKQGNNVVKAHLEHLEEHGEKDFLAEAMDYLKENGLENPLEGREKPADAPLPCGCPGTQVKEFEKKESAPGERQDSELRQWPMQLHLVPPGAPFFNNAELLIAADCVPFAYANFHQDFLKNRALVIGCPKLDDIEAYKEKISGIIETNDIKGITVAHMEVPCCFGLQQLVKEAVEKSGKNVKVEEKIVTVQGDLK